jgi:sulfate/thiosulfate transport system permease protein
MSEASRLQRFGLRGIALFYLTALLVVPVGIIFWKTFEEGVGPPLEAITSPEGMHAFYLTIVCVAIAVPLNTIFGVVTALLLVRHNFRGKALVNSLIDLPFAISPVVIGLALILIWGQDGWFGSWLEGSVGFQVIYAVPGMILATVFVSLPFVVREVMPVLQEIGTDQEQAAETLGASKWQTFWRVTLPAIRWGLAYGIVLATARALGEFGAVAVVSGKVSGQTETLPLFVENQYTNFNLAGAYAAAIVLAILALLVLFSMNLLQRRARKAEDSDNDGDEAPAAGVFVPHPIEKEA